MIQPPTSSDAAIGKLIPGIGKPAIAAKRAELGLTKLLYWPQSKSCTKWAFANALSPDAAYVEVGGKGAHFGEADAVQLGLMVERREACSRQLATELANVLRESGAAHADVIHVLASNAASDHVITRALVSVEEARSALSRVAARISSFLQVGAGPASGSTGASST